MTLKINVSLGERETLRGPKIAGQTKAWINQSFSFLPSSSFFPLHFFFFFFERKPLSSLTYTATPRLLGYDTCGCHPQTEGASFFFFFFFFCLRETTALLSFFFFFIYHLKFKRAEMETHALSIRGTPGTVWGGRPTDQFVQRRACVSDVPWKQRWLLITSTNSHSMRDLNGSGTFRILLVRSSDIYRGYRSGFGARRRHVYCDVEPFCNIRWWLLDKEA